MRTGHLLDDSRQLMTRSLVFSSFHSQNVLSVTETWVSCIFRISPMLYLC